MVGIKNGKVLLDFQGDIESLLWEYCHALRNEFGPRDDIVGEGDDDVGDNDILEHDDIVEHDDVVEKDDDLAV